MADNLGRPSPDGTPQDREVDPRLFRRDNGGIVSEFFSLLKTPDAGPIVIAMAVIAFIMPGWEFLMLLLGGIIITINLRSKLTLPFFLPMASGLPDPHSPKLGQPNKMSRAAGISYFGNEVGTNKEIWMPNEVLRQHMLVIGTTGAGKTAGLVSTIVYSALLQGSGCIYVDGKGDVRLPLEIMALARRFGREDDVLIISYMTGNKDMRNMGVAKSSNTFNPFVYGSSSSLSELIKGLLSGDNGSGGDMWKSRAEAYVDALIRPLVFLRDNKALDMNIGAFRDALGLDGVARMMRKLRNLEATLARSGVAFPVSVLDGITSFLRTLPGIKPVQADSILQGEMPADIHQTVLDQHGYITMQLTPVVNMLATDYGFIFSAPRGEVDMWDVVVNRRILIVLLPALEKAPGSLAHLGKIVLASFKSMMGMALGSTIEGDRYETLDARPTNSPNPFPVIFDEVGYYFVEGMAITAAQGRSLGFSMIFGAQDVPAMERRAKEEARSTIANTNIKIVGRVEDPKETLDIIQSRAGKAFSIESGGLERHDTEMGSKFYEQGSLSYHQRDRLSVRDLARLREGQVYMIYGDQVVRVDLFYADADPLPKNQINDFLQVMPPPEQIIKQHKQQYREKLARVRDIAAGRMTPSDVEINATTFIPKVNMRAAMRNGASGFEAALLGLLASHRYRSAYDETMGLTRTRDGVRSERGDNRQARRVGQVSQGGQVSKAFWRQGPEDSAQDEAAATQADMHDIEQSMAADGAARTGAGPDDMVVPPDQRVHGRRWGSRFSMARVRRQGMPDDYDDEPVFQDSPLGSRQVFERRTQEVAAAVNTAETEPDLASRLISEDDHGEFSFDMEGVPASTRSRAAREARSLADALEGVQDYPVEPTPSDSEQDVVETFKLLYEQMRLSAAQSSGEGERTVFDEAAENEFGDPASWQDGQPSVHVAGDVLYAAARAPIDGAEQANRLETSDDHDAAEDEVIASESESDANVIAATDDGSDNDSDPGESDRRNNDDDDDGGGGGGDGFPDGALFGDRRVLELYNIQHAGELGAMPVYSLEAIETAIQSLDVDAHHGPATQGLKASLGDDHYGHSGNRPAATNDSVASTPAASRETDADAEADANTDVDAEGQR